MDTASLALLIVLVVVISGVLQDINGGLVRHVEWDKKDVPNGPKAKKVDEQRTKGFNDVTHLSPDESEARDIEFWHGEIGKTGWNRREWEARVRKLDKPTRISTAKKQEHGPPCVCGASMVKRKNRRGEAFWGCSTYPKCRGYTVNIDRRA